MQIVCPAEAWHIVDAQLMFVPVRHRGTKTPLKLAWPQHSHDGVMDN